MQVFVNGRATEVASGTTVLGLIEQLSLAGKRIAVERNGEIVPRSLHDRTMLDPDDRLEVVVAVGGG